MTQRQLDRVYVVVADAVRQRGAIDEATSQRGSKLAALGNCASICTAARASGSTITIVLRDCPRPRHGSDICYEGDPRAT